MSTHTTVKTSISLPEATWHKVKHRKNRSSIIAKALELYLDMEEDLQAAEHDYWQKVKNSLKKDDGDYISLNPNGKKLTKQDIEQKLWN